jgi:hypothetical protein
MCSVNKENYTEQNTHCSHSTLLHSHITQCSPLEKALKCPVNNSLTWLESVPPFVQTIRLFAGP